MTNFTNAAGDGSVVADIGTFTSLTGALTGAVTASTLSASGLASLLGTLKLYGKTVVAAGATQGNATTVGTDSIIVIASATASTLGVKLPTAATNLVRLIISPSTIGVKVYPATNGKIHTAATNTAVLLAAGKANIYWAANTTQWYVLKGA